MSKRLKVIRISDLYTPLHVHLSAFIKLICMQLHINRLSAPTFQQFSVQDETVVCTGVRETEEVIPAMKQSTTD